MSKAYKAATPEATVARIKGIIDSLHLPIHEQTLGDGDMFCSCRIFLSHDEDSSIGTNGKGMSPIYARASGYAEFMERYQNRVLIYPNPVTKGPRPGFFPDERHYHWTRQEAEENIRLYTPRTATPLHDDIVSVDGVTLPFYHVNTGGVRQIPYSLIRWINGSNGMCAGNIREEALIQGFNEIFERYCMQEMYIRNIVPPDVPVEVFQNTGIMRRLNRMRNEYGFDFRVKDYSLGEGFPVIGLMVYNPDHTKYIMHLGADLSPEIALERCFTEVFQGYTAHTLKFENDINDCEKLNLFNEFKRSLMHGCGRLPLNYFNSQPSYAYTGHTTIASGTNFREDLNNICRWVMAKGYDIFIRDNSFAQFPTLQVVVPGMSEIDRTFCDLNRRVRHMQLTENQPNPLFRLHSLDKNSRIATIAYLESLDTPGVDLFTRNSNPHNHVNRHILLMLLHLSVGHKTLANEHLNAFAASGAPQERVATVRLFFERLKANPGQALNVIASPQCFECGGCELRDGCRFPLLDEIEQLTLDAMSRHDFDQSRLKEIFAV